MPEELEPTRVPLPPETSREILMRLVPDIDEDSMEAFLNLDESIQKEINDDISRQKKTGVKEGNLLARIKFLIHQGHELLNMPNVSDKSQEPRLTREEIIASLAANNAIEKGRRLEGDDIVDPNDWRNKHN